MADTARSRITALLAVLLILTLFFLLDMPLCPTRFVLGLPCPGCGFTRATNALLHGQPLSAWLYHPLVFVLLPLLSVIAYQETWRALKPARSGGLPRLLDAIPGRVWAGIGLVMIAVWGLRLSGYLGGHPDEMALSAGALWQLLP